MHRIISNDLNHPGQRAWPAQAHDTSIRWCTQRIRARISIKIWHSSKGNYFSCLKRTALKLRFFNFIINFFCLPGSNSLFLALLLQLSYYFVISLYVSFSFIRLKTQSTDHIIYPYIPNTSCGSADLGF